MPPTQHIVIVGAGFGGLTLARALAHEPVRVTLVDRENFHTFQPLLYQVATAGLEGESIAHAVRGIFHGQINIDVRLGTVVGVDLDNKVVATDEGPPIAYDQLVLAVGAKTATFGVPGVDAHAFGLKTLYDALALRSHLLRQFELADAERPLPAAGSLNVVISGGGPTGVEMAGALAELFSRVLAKDHPRLDLSQARIVLVEAGDRLLPSFDRRLGDHARNVLTSRGVDVRVGCAVNEVTAAAVHLADGEILPAGTVVWAAGVRAASLGAELGLETDATGRVVVGPDLRVPSHRDVWVIGDLAAPIGQQLPQLAPVAIQQAQFVARALRRHRSGRPLGAFRYRDKGTMATIGRNEAVAQLPLGLRFTGFTGWVMWLGLHLIQLVGFRNRASVLVDWAWNYLTWDRGARIIVSPPR